MCRAPKEFVHSNFYQEYINNLHFNCICGENILVKLYANHIKECPAINQLCSSHTCKSTSKCQITVRFKSSEKLVCSHFCKFMTKIQTIVKPIIKTNYQLVAKQINTTMTNFLTKVTNHKLSNTLNKAVKIQKKPPTFLPPIPLTRYGKCDFNFTRINPDLWQIAIEDKNFRLDEPSYNFRTVISDRVLN